MPLSGIDTSTYQGFIDGAKVAAAGKTFVACKVTDATGSILFADPVYADNSAATVAAGMALMNYHEYGTAASVQAQAAMFCKLAKPGFDWFIVEHFNQMSSNPNKVLADYAAFSAECVSQGRKPTGMYVDYSTYVWMGEPKLSALWLADAGVAVPGAPCLVWQYGQGAVDGVTDTVDLDAFYGTLQELHDLTGALMTNIENAIRTNGAPVTILSSHDGGGYAIVCSDGGVITFGDMPFEGSAGGLHLDAPITAAFLSPSGSGYTLVGGDGGAFTYGDAQFHGSAAGMVLDGTVVGAVGLPDGSGYYMITGHGEVIGFGDAKALGRIQYP